MASLKEVRARIASVTSTSKITSAMKLVSAAKLRRAQDAITSYLPYQQTLTKTLEDFLSSSTDELSMPLTQHREVKRVAILAISSNSSLCGAFNSNVSKKVNELLKQYADLQSKDILFFPIGKRISEAVNKLGFKLQGDFNNLVDKLGYAEVGALTDTLVNLFLNKEVDRVELVYNHFKNAGVQVLTHEQFLPMLTSQPKAKLKHTDFILEPEEEQVLKVLVPKVIRLRLYSALLDSIAAEHGARTTAMQIATDNATELIKDLTLAYNKARQSAITNELIDIVGGSEVLK